MSNDQLNQEYKNMMSAAAKMAFITAVRRNENATLAEVVAMAEAEGLGDLTVKETFFEKVQFGASPKLLPAASKSPNRPSVNRVSTRTPADRANYEAKLLERLKTRGKWIGAQELRQQVGGTPLQARKALNRLIEQGHIKYRGKARATKYRVRKNKSKAA